MQVWELSRARKKSKRGDADMGTENHERSKKYSEKLNENTLRVMRTEKRGRRDVNCLSLTIGMMITTTS